MLLSSAFSVSISEINNTWCTGGAYGSFIINLQNADGKMQLRGALQGETAWTMDIQNGATFVNGLIAGNWQISVAYSSACSNSWTTNVQINNPPSMLFYIIFRTLILLPYPH